MQSLVAIEYFPHASKIDSMLPNTEKKIHGRLRETKVETKKKKKKKKNPFSGAARAQVRPTFSLRIGS